MSGISISIVARARTVIREFIRNGKAPVAELQNRLAELCGHAAIAHTRQLFVRNMPITAILASGGTSARTRWRFAARSHPYPLYWIVRMEMAPQNDGIAISDPYTRLDITTTSDTSTILANAEVHFGSGDGSLDDTPNNLGGGWQILVAGSAATGDYWTPDPSTTYAARFSDTNYARLFAACVYEVSLEADTTSGYQPLTTALGTPIYDSDRQTPLVMARSIYKDASAPLWNWGSDHDGVAPSIAGADSWTMEKTGGSNGVYDAGAASNQTISGAGKVTITVDVTTKERAFGLSTTDANANFNTIERGIIMTASGGLYKTENGTFSSIGSYAASDVLAVERDGSNNITYTKNGSSLSSGTSLSGSLLIDTSMSDSAGKLPIIKFYDVSTQIAVTWQNSTNVTLTQP